MKIKLSIFFTILLYLYQIVNADTLYQFTNFSMKPSDYQPSGNIIYDYQPSENIIMFKKHYKKYTTFEIEKISNNNFGNNFGNNFRFSPVNDLCHNNFEKNNTINCLKKYPNEWWCIYENCISFSRNQIKYYPIKFNEFIIKKEYELPFAN